MRTAQESVHLVAATIGFVSYAALWAGTLWGTVLRSGWATSRLRHHTVHGIHMHVTLLGLTLGVVHSLVQMAAPYEKVRAIDVVVPFTDRADPIGVGLGVIALELMIATALSVLIQRTLGYARWRALHSLGYLSFTMVAAHILISGTEVYRAPVRAAIAASWGMVVVAGISTVAPVARIPRAVLDRLSPRHRADEITVSVDPGKCGSFGFCEQEAPGIFTLRSDQRLAYRSVVSSDQAEAAMRAAVVCPARAIKLGRLPATVVVSQPAADTSGVSPLATSLTPLRATPASSPHTGPRPRVPARVHTGPQPGVHTGPQPGVHTGPQPGVHTGPQPGVHTGPQPAVAAAGPAAGPHTGPLAPARLGAGAHSGPLPAVGATGVGSHTGSLPAVGAVAGLRPVAGSKPAPSLAAGAGGRSAGGRGQFRPAAVPVRRRNADPPPDDALPPPDQLQDTGRHHLPRLRGIAGGRS